MRLYGIVSSQKCPAVYLSQEQSQERTCSWRRESADQIIEMQEGATDQIIEMEEGVS